MGCVKLLKGFDLNCVVPTTRYYQSVVLINRADVNEYVIDSGETNHRISFNLKAGSSGFLFRGNENGSLISAGFAKSTDKGIPLYSHKVSVPVIGSSENIKTLLMQMDGSDFFAVIQAVNGDVEVYGFENGLSSGDYDFQLQSSLGGAAIDLSSKFEEFDPPYIYYSAGLETLHFDTNFEGIGAVLNGDFNDDFSDDFYIAQ